MPQSAESVNSTGEFYSLVLLVTPDGGRVGHVTPRLAGSLRTGELSWPPKNYLNNSAIL